MSWRVKTRGEARGEMRDHLMEIKKSSAQQDFLVKFTTTTNFNGSAHIPRAASVGLGSLVDAFPVSNSDACTVITVTSVVHSRRTTILEGKSCLGQV